MAPGQQSDTMEAEGEHGLRAYASIVRTKEAYAFDFATFIMRLYMPMITIGVVSMLTLAGAVIDCHIASDVRFGYVVEVRMEPFLMV